MGQQLFAGAGFAGDQQRGIHQGHAGSALLELLHLLRGTQNCVKTTCVVVLQGAELLTHAAGRTQCDDGPRHAGVGFLQRGGFHHVGLAIELHLGHWQVVIRLGQQGHQVRQTDQALKWQADNRRGQWPTGDVGSAVGHHHHAIGIQCKHRVSLGGQQRVQVQAALGTGQHGHWQHGQHTWHPQQVGAQAAQPGIVKLWGFNEYVGWVDLDCGHVVAALGRGGQNFLGNAHPVSE